MFLLELGEAAGYFHGEFRLGICTPIYGATAACRQHPGTFGPSGRGCQCFSAHHPRLGGTNGSATAVSGVTLLTSKATSEYRSCSILYLAISTNLAAAAAAESATIGNFGWNHETHEAHEIKPKPQRGGRKQMAGSHDAAAEAQLSARVHHVGGEIVTRLQRWISSLRQKPRALPWAILWRPFRPAVGTIIPE